MFSNLFSGPFTKSLILSHIPAAILPLPLCQSRGEAWVE